MGKSLVIVESPAKAQTLRKYLVSDFLVEASVGHIRDLPPKEIGVDVDNDFKPTYELIRGKGTVVKKIKDAAKKVETVYLAPDPDREGEAIAWHIAQEIGKLNKNVYRILIHEITRKGVAQALATPLDLDHSKFESQQARRILDRLVGYKISPLLWTKVRRGLSAGRVQSVAVRMIVDREREIESFKPEEYWNISARLSGELPPPFTARLATINGRKEKVTNGEQAAAIAAESSSGTFKVASVVRKERKRSAAPAFTTAKLQQEAARQLRFTTRKTMQLAQRLYEGIDLGTEGATGLITYMRTDSTRLSDDAVSMARTFIKDQFGSEYLPAKPNVYKNKKNAQDAHEAIRPTSVEWTPEKVRRWLEPDAYKLYRLIFNKFIACQMKPTVYNMTTVDIECGKLGYRAVGSVMKFPGYLAVWGITDGSNSGKGNREEQPDDETGQDNNNEDTPCTLPPLEEGQTLTLGGIDTEQKFTEPPPRFNEASLVKELEDKGIGRPSTYASIISTIQDKKYVEKQDGKFLPSELGLLVTDLLVQSFPDIVGIEFTAHMEDDLDRVEEGQVDWLAMLREFYGPFAETLEKAREDMRNMKRAEEATDIKCEKCGNPMVIKWGKNGYFLACSGYPKCKNTKEIEKSATGEVEVKEEEVAKEPCPSCGGKMVYKNSKFGRFLACTNYPDCKGKRPIMTGVACPADGCNGQLVEKTSHRGKVFYSCDQYPQCTYALWDKPVPKKCPDCGNPFMVLRQPKRSGRTSKTAAATNNEQSTKLVCPVPECGHIHNKD